MFTQECGSLQMSLCEHLALYLHLKVKPALSHAPFCTQEWQLCSIKYAYDSK